MLSPTWVKKHLKLTCN